MPSSRRPRDPRAIARELLAYLVEHPHAQDTVDGIVHWWLRPRGIEAEPDVVQQAVRALVDSRLLLEIHAPDGRLHYCVNGDRWDDVLARVENGAD